MIHIQKSDEPDFLLEFKKKYPHKTYDSEEFVKYRILLKDVLIREQKGLCGYCCGRITQETSHNEHIEPRHPGKYSSDKTLDYYNIIASCNNPDTCGKAKENKYESDRFISPLEDDCEEKFSYYIDGYMDGDDYTINLLNLNDYSLRNARKSVCRILQALDKETIKMIYLDETEEYPAYYNVIKWYYDSL